MTFEEYRKDWLQYWRFIHWEWCEEKINHAWNRKIILL